MNPAGLTEAHGERLWAFSCARMEAAMNRLEAIAIDVRVLLRCPNVGVSKQFLHGPQVGAAGEQMRCEAMPQRVRAYAGIKARAADVLLH